MIRQYEVWLADLNPRHGTGPGNRRPVCVVQTDLLNAQHPSTLICPLTTNVLETVEILRVHLTAGDAHVRRRCDIMIDQVRAIDNRRLVRKLGKLPEPLARLVKENLKIVLDL